MTQSAIHEKQNWKKVAFPLATALLAFLIPILKGGIQIPIFLVIIAWFFYPKRTLKQQWWPILVFSGIFLFHIIGLFYSEYLDKGIADSTGKLSLLLFPVIYGLAAPVSRRFRRITLICFAAGTIFSVIFDLVSSAADYSRTGMISEFYMSAFSPIFHPSYVAMYINMAIAVLLTSLTGFSFTRKQKGLLWLLIFFLATSLVFPSSKMGFVTFGFLVLFFLVKWASQKRVIHINSLLIIIIGVVTALLITYNPVASNRVNSAIEFADGDRAPTKTDQIESNAARIYAWKAAVSEIKENPLGVGTGDINVELEKRFREEGLDQLADKGLNPHNQYLQTAMALGLPAIAWFLFSLLFPFAKIVKTKDWLYAFFICIIALNLMVESMLEKQSGVIFFAFFNSFFYFMTLQDRKLE